MSIRYAAAAALLVLTGSLADCASGPSTEVVRGYYLDASILGGGGCPIAHQVQFLAPSGKVLASMALRDYRKAEQQEGFTVGGVTAAHIYAFQARVKAGLSHYGVRIGDQTNWFTERQMTAHGSPFGNSYAAAHFHGVQLSCR